MSVFRFADSVILITPLESSNSSYNDAGFSIINMRRSVLLTSKNTSTANRGFLRSYHKFNYTTFLLKCLYQNMISCTIMHMYVKVIKLSCVPRLTRLVSLVEQELPSLPEHLSSPPVFSGIRITRSLVLYLFFVDRCLSFCAFSFGHCVVCSSSIYRF